MDDARESGQRFLDGIIGVPSLVERRHHANVRRCHTSAITASHEGFFSLGSAIDDNRAVAAVLRGVAKLVRVSKVYRWKSEEQPIRGQPPWGRDVAMVAFEPS